MRLVAAAAAAAALALVQARAAPVLMLPPSGPAAGAGTAASKSLGDGYDALVRGDLLAAEAAFKEASRADSRLAAAFIGLAEVAAQRDQHPQAEAWLKRALALDPQGASTLRVWGRYLARRGRLADAETALRKAVAADPASLDAKLDLGDTLLAGRKGAKAAEQVFAAAAAQDPRSAAAQLGLGRALAAQRRLDDAAARYEQASRLASTDPRPAHALARLRAAQGKADLALAALDRVTAIDPGFLAAYIDRGDLLLAGNDVDRAIAAYRAGAQSAREPALAYFRLGKALEAKAMWEESDSAYLDALKADPKMFAALNNLAFNAAARKQNLEQALAWARQAISLAPDNTTLYDTLGWVHRARGELDAAAKAIEKAVAGNPRQAGFQYHLGVVYAEQGRQRDASAALQKALQIDPNFRQSADAKARLQGLKSKPA
jgi:tetratricopeptide (TPR) repeat protein